MEVAACTDTRQLSSTAIDFLTEKYANEFAQREAKTEQQKQLNFICNQVFVALAYYRKENRESAFAVVAHQYLWDIRKHFTDETARMLLDTHEYKSIESIGMLRKFIDFHNSRVFSS